MYTFVMAGGEKTIGKALPLVGFLSYLDSRTYHTQAVLLESTPPLYISYCAIISPSGTLLSATTF